MKVVHSNNSYCPKAPEQFPIKESMGKSKIYSPVQVARAAYSFPSRPVVSYGLMVYARDTKRWLLVQRRHSAEFLLVLRGSYRVSILPQILAGITLGEAELLKGCLAGGPVKLRQVYNDLNLDLKDFHYSLTRMAECRHVLLDLLQHMTFSQSLSWNWPKGRLQRSEDQTRETPFECALREFREEVEVVLPGPVKVSKIPFIEKTATSSGKNLESRCWVYVVAHEFNLMESPSNDETGAVGWFGADQIRKLVTSPMLFDYVVSLGPW